MIRLRMACVMFSLLLATALAFCQENPENTFRGLYGKQFDEALKSPDKADDLALARQLYRAAQDADADPALQALLCYKTLELGKTAGDAAEVAVDSMKFLAAKKPDQAEACLTAVVDLWQTRFSKSQGFEQKDAGKQSVLAMLALADAQATAGKFNDALATAEKAIRMAGLRAPEFQTQTRDRMQAIRFRQATARKVEQMEAALKANPADARTRNELLRVYVAECDAPQKALPLLTADCDQQFSTYVPLAVKPPAEVPQVASRDLGDWYRSLAAAVDATCRAPLLRRAHTYYLRSLSGLKSDDPAAVKLRLADSQAVKALAATGESLDGTVMPSLKGVREMSDEIKAFAASRDQMPPREQVKAVLEKMREMGGSANVWLEDGWIQIEGDKVVGLTFGRTILHDGEIKKSKGDRNPTSNDGLHTIDPLYGMPLKRLTIEGGEIQDLAALVGMPLEELCLAGRNSARVNSLSGIQTLSLKGLVLPAKDDLRGDLTFLAHMKNLESLTISQSNISSLNGLQNCTKLTSLTIAKADVASLLPIRGLKLKELEIDDADELKMLDGVQGMPIEKLTLRNWGGLKGSLVGLNRFGLSKLTTLTVEGCEGMVRLDGIQGLPLTKLFLGACQNLRGDLSACKGMKLTHVNLAGCDSLASLNGLQGIEFEELVMNNCGVTSLEGLKGAKVAELVIDECRKLTNLNGLEGMPLQKLMAKRCPLLRDLSGLMGTQLTDIDLRGCTSLRSLEGLQGLPLQRINVEGCTGLSRDALMLLRNIPTLTRVETGDDAVSQMILGGSGGKKKNKG